MEVSSCRKQEGVSPRYILTMGTTIDSFFFFSKSTRGRFPSVSHFFIQLGRLQNSQFFPKIALV